MAASLVWFRQDLRLQDNAALAAALARGHPIVPVFVLDDAGEGRWPLGAASRWWLHHSLAALSSTLQARDSSFVLARGDSLAMLRRLIRLTGADVVYGNRRYEPAAVRQDEHIAAALSSDGVALHLFEGALLHQPSDVRNRQGRPFQVFTPFWRHCLTLPVAPPIKVATGTFPGPAKWPESTALERLDLLPRINWDREFPAQWSPGESNAIDRLRTFARTAIGDYAEARDCPAEPGTSLLSPHLHFGEITPRQVWARIQAESRASGVFPPHKGATVFLNEIGWREFAYHLLTHFPDTPEKPLRPAFTHFPWASDHGGRQLKAWQRGRTGYPIIDAGMRQLWRTGWMHNRVRMVVGSFLVKHLRLPWTEGAAWFWDTLVDADLANNTLGWQWIAGCGADAAPYFRIFAPVAQGEKFDPSGDYVRRWVPELAALPSKYVHAPWTAPAEVLAAADIRLGETYPHPIVDHATARRAALAAFQTLRAGGS